MSAATDRADEILRQKKEAQDASKKTGKGKGKQKALPLPPGVSDPFKDLKQNQDTHAPEAKTGKAKTGKAKTGKGIEAAIARSQDNAADKSSRPEEVDEELMSTIKEFEPARLEHAARRVWGLPNDHTPRWQDPDSDGNSEENPEWYPRLVDYVYRKLHEIDNPDESIEKLQIFSEEWVDDSRKKK